MALTAKKFSELAAASLPLAGSKTVVLVGEKTTVADIRLMPKSTISALPTPVAGLAGAVYWVTDASGGAVPAYCDGTAWKRFDTNAAVT